MYGKKLLFFSIGQVFLALVISGILFIALPFELKVLVIIILIMLNAVIWNGFLFRAFKKKQLELYEWQHKYQDQAQETERLKLELANFTAKANPFVVSFGDFNLLAQHAAKLHSLLSDTQAALTSLETRLLKSSINGEVLYTNQELLQKSFSQLEADVHKAFDISDNLSTSAKNAFDISEKVQKEVPSVTQALNNSLLSSQKLLDQSQQISRIVTMLSELSSRINILSINASIVSARAGQAGNPFKVVAKEIRKLAGETDKSLNAINEDIKNIQALINQVSEQIKYSVKQTQDETASLLSVVSALQGITLGVEVFRAVSKSTSDKFSSQKNILADIFTQFATAQNTLQGLQDLAQELTRIKDITQQALNLVSNVFKLPAEP